MIEPKELKPAQLSEAIKSYGIFASLAGEKVVDDLKKRFGADAPAFVETPGLPFDPIRAAIRDGQRQVILHIERAIHLATHEQEKKISKARIA